MLQRLPMLLIGALLVIGGVLAASPGFAATGKYCSPTADNIVVYIDRTTNYDDKDKKDLVDGVSKLFASLQGGERFSIRTISDSFTTSTSLIDDCVPVCASKGFLGDLFSSDCTEGVAINENNAPLVLSREAGAWDELGPGGAIVINPFDIVGTADALHHALSLDAAERAERAEKLRAVATARTPAGWLQKQLDAVAPSEQP